MNKSNFGVCYSYMYIIHKIPYVKLNFKLVSANLFRHRMRTVSYANFEAKFLNNYSTEITSKNIF